MNAKVKRIKPDFAFVAWRVLSCSAKRFHGDLRVRGVFEQLAPLAMRYQESGLHWSLLFFDFC